MFIQRAIKWAILKCKIWYWSLRISEATPEEVEEYFAKSNAEYDARQREEQELKREYQKYLAERKNEDEQYERDRRAYEDAEYERIWSEVYRRKESD